MIRGRALYYSSSEDDINEIFFEVNEILSDWYENISNICEIFWKSRYYLLTLIIEVEVIVIVMKILVIFVRYFENQEIYLSGEISIWIIMHI